MTPPRVCTCNDITIFSLESEKNEVISRFQSHISSPSNRMIDTERAVQDYCDARIPEGVRGATPEIRELEDMASAMRTVNYYKKNGCPPDPMNNFLGRWLRTYRNRLQDGIPTPANVDLYLIDNGFQNWSYEGNWNLPLAEELVSFYKANRRFPTFEENEKCMKWFFELRKLPYPDKNSRIIRLLDDKIGRSIWMAPMDKNLLIALKDAQHRVDFYKKYGFIEALK